VHANFHEKAHFVKGRRGGLFEVERNGSMSFAHAAMIRLSWRGGSPVFEDFSYSLYTHSGE
jgi:hypothetical protein